MTTTRIPESIRFSLRSKGAQRRLDAGGESAATDPITIFGGMSGIIRDDVCDVLAKYGAADMGFDYDAMVAEWARGYLGE